MPGDRIVAKRYGSTRLLNHCVPGVECTEEEHAENRRSTYAVMGPPSDRMRRMGGRSPFLCVMGTIILRAGSVLFTAAMTMGLLASCGEGGRNLPRGRPGR